MPSSDYSPDLETVGALVRTRTKTPGGKELGTFNPADADPADRTKPTAEEVTKLIAVATRKVEAKIGPDIPAEMVEDAKGVVALRTALLIELTLFPEQVATGRSPYKELKAEFEEDLATLISDIQSIESGGEEGVTGGEVLPRFAFDDPDNTELIGWKTVW